MISERPFVLIGTPEDQHVTLFQEALARLALPPALVIAYTDLLEKRIDLDAAIPRDAIVRIDSPGKEWAVNRALAIRGSEKKHYPHFPVLDDPRQYIPSWAWYAGFCMALESLQGLQKRRADILWINPLPDIRLMLDREGCCNYLHRHHVPTPLLERRRGKDFFPPIFLKPRYNSGRSALIARHTHHWRSFHETFSTTLSFEDGKLMHSPIMRQVQGKKALQTDEAARRWQESEAIHEEPWFSKATLSGKAFDLRVVMIGGRTRHIVARTGKVQLPSHFPANVLESLEEPVWSHFWRALPKIRGFMSPLKPRSVTERVMREVPNQLWQTIGTVCQQVAFVFSESLVVGIDLVISADWTKPYVLEVNPFGNPMPNLLHEGEDTYTAEIKAALARADKMHEDNI